MNRIGQSPLGRRFQLLWAAAAASNLADGARLAALPLLATTITRDPVKVAGVAVAQQLPWLLLGLHAGALIDRVETSALIRGVQMLRAAVMISLAIMALTGHGTLLMIYSAAFLLGAGELLADGAMQVLVPALAPQERLDLANGRLAAAQMVLDRFVGPPVGGYLFALASALPFGLSGVAYSVSSLLMLVLRRWDADHPPRTRMPMLGQIKEGLQWLWRQPLLRVLALWISLINFSIAMFQAVYVLFVLEVLGLGATAYGVLLTASAAGGVVGALGAEGLARAIGSRRTILLTGAVTAIGTLSVGLSRHAVLIGLLMFVTGVFVVAMNVIVRSLRQRLVPRDLLGRVVTTYRTIGHGAVPLGAMLGGWIGAAWGLRAPFLTASAIMAIATVGVVPTVQRAGFDEQESSAGEVP